MRRRSKRLSTISQQLVLCNNNHDNGSPAATISLFAHQSRGFTLIPSIFVFLVFCFRKAQVGIISLFRGHQSAASEALHIFILFFFSSSPLLFRSHLFFARGQPAQFNFFIAPIATAAGGESISSLLSSFAKLLLNSQSCLAVFFTLSFFSFSFVFCFCFSYFHFCRKEEVERNKHEKSSLRPSHSALTTLGHADLSPTD